MRVRQVVHVPGASGAEEQTCNQFRDPKKPFWSIDRSKPYEIDPEIYEYYKNGAGIEPASAMAEYNAKENYGSAAAAGLSGTSAETKGSEKTNAAGLKYNPMID